MGYDLSELPKAALPQMSRVHKGLHSYTVQRGEARIEVLLRTRAYFVKNGRKSGQVTWSKFGGPKNAWITACTRAGVLPFPPRVAKKDTK